MLVLLLSPVLAARCRRGIGAPRVVRLTALLAIAFATMACWEGRELAGYRAGRTALSGELHIVGSPTMVEPTRAWIAIFRREHPAVRVLAHLDGAGAAAGAMAAGDADVAQMTRPMRPAERDHLRLAGERPDYVRIGASPDHPDEELLIYLGEGRHDRASAIEFARIALSGEGQDELARAGYAPLDPHARREMDIVINRLSEREGVS